MDLLIKMMWDPEDHVWIEGSDDVPGLVLESSSFDALLERVRFVIPELLTLNGDVKYPLRLSFVAERHEQIEM